jgi:23S rRNA pseudouridine1911/1915/1917 synthase
MVVMAKKSQVLRLKVSDVVADMRLDQWLASAHESLSRTLAKKIIDLGGVHLNGRRIRKCSQLLRCGDSLEIYQDGQPLEVYRLDDQALIFRDRYVLALNKPAGIDCQPTPARYKGTLYEALLTYLKDPFRPLDKPELAMVQRLDRETSGVMIFSIHRRSHKPLTDIWQTRKVTKVYHALVTDPGLADTGEFISELARNRRTNRMKSVAKGGKYAHTRYRVVQRFSGYALVEVDLLTGRTHQIRVHFSEAGAPLLGDRLYGGNRQPDGIPISRTMLHSSRLMCDHPITHSPLVLEAPWPEDFCLLLNQLGGHV